MDTAEGEAPFRSVYDQHRTDVLAYFLRRLGPEDAAEATADVFLVVWRRIDQLPPVSERRLWQAAPQGRPSSSHWPQN